MNMLPLMARVFVDIKILQKFEIKRLYSFIQQNISPLHSEGNVRIKEWLYPGDIASCGGTTCCRNQNNIWELGKARETDSV